MKKRVFYISLVSIFCIVLHSCRVSSGAGGVTTSMSVNTRARSNNTYDLVPAGDRITYTIDISTPEGKLKLHKLSIKEAQVLAETEASRKYNCDRLIDPRFNYLKKGKRILRITVDGRPGVYKTRD